MSASTCHSSATAGGHPRYSVKYGSINAFNAMMTEQRRALSLQEVLRQHDDVHARLVEYVRAAPDELIRTETRFRRRLKLDAIAHSPIHARAIRAWRESHPGPPSPASPRAAR